MQENFLRMKPSHGLVYHRVIYAPVGIWPHIKIKLNVLEGLRVHLCSRSWKMFDTFLYSQIYNLLILQFFLFTYYHWTPCNLENSPVKKITINILRERSGKQCKITVDPLKIIFLIAQFKSNKWTRIYNWSLRRQMWFNIKT